MGVSDWLGRLFAPHQYYQDLADSAGSSASGGPKNYAPNVEKKFSPAAIDVEARRGRPHWVDWDADQAVDLALKQVAWVYICVHKLASSAASVPFLAEEPSEDEADGWTTATGSSLHAFLQEPNDKWAMSSIIYRIVASLCLSGNAILTKTRALGEPVEMWPHFAANIRPIPDPEEFIRAYKWGSGANARVEPAEDVIHIQFDDVSDAYWGMSPLEAGWRTVQTEKDAVDWQKSSVRNAAMPSGFLSIKRKFQSEKDYEAVRKKIRRELSGASNARRVGILDENADWLATQMSAMDLDFIVGRRMNREEICALLGVPPPTVGIYENATLANIQTAREMLWVDTVLPLLNTIVDALNLSLAPEFGNNLRVGYDAGGVEALWPLFERRLEAAAKLQRLGYSANEINRRLQLGMPRISPDRDIGLVPGGMTPAAAFAVDTFGDDQ
jgi:HK97 family phage portal protein